MREETGAQSLVEMVGRRETTHSDVTMFDERYATVYRVLPDLFLVLQCGKTHKNPAMRQEVSAGQNERRYGNTPNIDTVVFHVVVHSFLRVRDTLDSREYTVWGHDLGHSVGNITQKG